MSDVLERLRAQFVERCRSDLARLGEPPDGDGEAGRIIHRLAGAAGSFGFARLGEAAAAVDVRLREGEPMRPADLDALREALAAVADGEGGEP